MAPTPTPPDEQDLAEIFDETHLDDEGDGDLNPDELDDVLDVTRVDDEDEDLEEEASSEFDDLDEMDRAAADTGDEGPIDAGEIELVYSGLMRNVKGAQGSTAHWEARRLDDDDIDALGYAPDDLPSSKEAP